MYSLVLISQDFLFSCLPLCDTSSWISLDFTSLVPSTLSLSYLSLPGPSHRSCQDVCKPSHFHQTLTQPLDTVSQPLVPLVLVRATLVACVAVCIHLSQYSVLVARQSALTEGHSWENRQCVGIKGSSSQLPETFGGGDRPSPGSSLELGEHHCPDDYQPRLAEPNDQHSSIPDSLHHCHRTYHSHHPTLPTHYVQTAG
jgi:hypothetical protein